MNLLGIAKVLKDIRVGELDTNSQIILANYINKAFTTEFEDVNELSGVDIINLLSKGLIASDAVMSREVFKHSSQLIYFLENVERIRNDRIYNSNLNDAVMGTSIAYFATLLLVLTLCCIAIYNVTGKSRSHIPESHVSQVLHILTESIVPDAEVGYTHDVTGDTITTEEKTPDATQSPPPNDTEPVTPASAVMDDDG